MSCFGGGWLQGVTRDRCEALGSIASLEFTVVDTAGLEAAESYLRTRHTPDAQLMGSTARTHTFLKPASAAAEVVRQVQAQSQVSDSGGGGKEPLSVQLQEAILEQTERAVRECDVILFLIDARAGVTPMDHYFANWLRKRLAKTVITADGTSHTLTTPVILCANKVEHNARREAVAGAWESYELGLGEPVPISAEHGDGFGELYNQVAAKFKVG
jgi:predicted GTPase